jgi:predicted acylesterase/phospholipase RssA
MPEDRPILLHPERWGRLRSRYEVVKPRKMLALDGGGIRGLITLGILKRLEGYLGPLSGRGQSFRLSDYFDYVAGTSTGAIIAAGLARGMSVDQLITFYKNSGHDMFEKSRLDRRLVSFYTGDPLREQLKKVFNADEEGRYNPDEPDKDLSPDNLRCLLLVVTRNVTTDSPWPISSNPDARYNDPARRDCNLRIPLWQLVRASTAAPIYFPPEILRWDPSDPLRTFVFVDGGMTPYNNPAFLLFRMATHPLYRLGWNTGEENLLLISIGTGMADDPSFSSSPNIMSNLVGIPSTLMHGIQIEQDINCRVAGRCTYGDFIDRELRDLTCRDAGIDCSVEAWRKADHLPINHGLGRAFLYARYNADLSQEGLDALGCGNMDPKKVQKLDAVDQIDNLLQVGLKAGETIHLGHLGSFAEKAGAAL